MCQSVSQSVSMFENEKTRDRSPRVNLAGRLGSSTSKLFRRPLLLPACCVLNCSRFLCVGKF